MHKPERPKQHRLSMKKHRKKLLTVLILLILAGAAAVVGINICTVESTRDRIFPASEPEAPILQGRDCVLVLGAGVRPDGSPSDMLADRVKTGLAVYSTGAVPKILMSGDHGRSHYDEVGCMLGLALEAGVPAEDVFLDHAGFSTYESLYRAKEIFGVESLVIVSQGYHLHRALYIADVLGLDAVGVSADLRLYAGQPMRDLREAAARVKDMLTVWIRPEPTYLGEKIPITGVGTVTQE